METKKALSQLPVASTDFDGDATFLMPRGALRFRFSRDGTPVRGGIRFTRVVATRTRAESACTAWHIEGAYDTLVEVEGSSWLGEIQAAIPAHRQGDRPLGHFMIYLDSFGSLEVLAEGWEAMPEEVGNVTDE
jgi:hypothetical protein